MTTLKLSRSNPGTPWGFRIHGGKDFGQPLVVLKVTAPSIASTQGLSPGDILLKINNADASTLTHKAAQDLIKNAGNVVEFQVVKATSTWAPTVTPVTPQSGASDQVWTQTSLKKGQNVGGGGGYGGINSKAKPFAVKGKNKFVNTQFNSPINIYSDASIAETLSAQAEVLAGGAIGVNFKKNEKKYNYENSEVYKMLQQSENAEDGVVSMESPRIQPQQQQQQVKLPVLKPVQQQQQSSPIAIATQPVNFQPITTAVSAPIATNNPTAQLPPGANICADCERLIVGVFVRIKEKNLHVDCFKCSTCGQSLKNVGYYNINNKLYCDIHAKLVARQQNPGVVAGGFSPVATATPPIATAKPFNYTPTLPTPTLPSPTGKWAGPAPFQSQHVGSGLISHVTAPKSPTTSSQISSQQQNYFESFEKNEKTSSFSETSSVGGKVVWPPAGGLLLGQQSDTQNQQQKFKQQHVPYQPLSSLLMQQPLIAPQQQQQYAPQQQQQSQQYAPQQQQQQQSPRQQQQFAPQQQYAQQKKPAYNNNALQNKSTNFGAGGKSASSSILANRIGRGILNQPSARVAVCGVCSKQIRGPFISTGATKFYCPTHFNCASCSRDLMDVGFVDLSPGLHCEFCWEANIAPPCGKCGKRIKFECLKALGRDFHPECFTCKQCGKKFGKEPFFVEDGGAYCQGDWNEMFTTKCYGCSFPIEAGDRWVEAMGQNYHSQCFNCSACKKNLEGQSFFAKQGRPFCKSHAR